MRVESGKTYVRNLRARSSERDALALRLRLDGALSSMDLHPPGVPASAIVCVRRLSARGPRASARDPLGAARSWESDVASSLARIVAQAARPARGPVPPGAEAVLFADRAELLACLASDWLRGAATVERWWWRGLVRARAGARALVLGEWMDAPEYAPAALERLARERLAVAFARGLGEAGASALLERVAHVYGLPGLRASPETDAHTETHTDELRGDSRGAENAGRGERDRRAGDDSRAAPWREYLEEGAADGLGPEQESLLGVVLTLARAPHRARSSAFAHEVRQWRANPDTSAADAPQSARDADKNTFDASAPREGKRVEETSLEDASSARRERPAASAKDLSPARGDSREARDAGHGREEAETRDEASRRRAGPEGEAAGGEDAGASKFSSGGARGAEESPRVEHEGGADGNEVGESEERARPSAAEFERSEAASPLFEARVETKLGGLFYLVNVGLFLELYGDFTTPLKPGLALPVWDFVALIGRELCGAEIREDPVWPLLARLSGRAEGEEPGLHFEPPAVWRLPPSWLKPFDEAEQERLLDSDGIREAGSGKLSLERWAGLLAEYVRARLRVALGLVEGAEVSSVVFGREAKVFVTETRVDVVFKLTELPLEVRLAGLDRDPGWVPAAGRFVAFHFE